jgi:FkbM family methyltransferase
MHYQKALQLNPNLAEAYHNAGILLQEKGKLDEALMYHQKALQLNANFNDTADNLRHLNKMKAIIKLLRKENPLILEVGSHVGEHTIFFLNAFKDIRIYCFEPDPRCIAKFRGSIKDQRCTLIEGAVSNTDGTTLLNLSGGLHPMMAHKGDWDASSSIKKAMSHNQRYPWLTFDSTVEVKTIRLDTWVLENNISYIDFIWSDVQGAERDLIKGAEYTLKMTKYFYTEYGEISTYPEAMTRDETIAILTRKNFKIIQELSDTGEIGNLLFENKDV